MSISDDAPPYHYIAFIDEAGDPGIDSVRPIDESGGSEWLVIGAMLIQRKNEQGPVQWVRSILDSAEATQRAQLHYRHIKEWQKPIVCREVAALPMRAFALLSNKKSMRGHTNERAAAKGNPLTSKQWFYNFCLRLILERVTDYCYRHSVRMFGEPRRVKIIFSKRGGHSYGHTIGYNEILKNQGRSGTTFLQKRTIRWEVIDRRLQEEALPALVAGLQLADVIASAFYQAVDVLPPTIWEPGNAKLLKPRMARERGAYNDYGVAFQPTPVTKTTLVEAQMGILEFYGYDRRDFKIVK